MTFQTQYGPVKDGKLQAGGPKNPIALELSEDDNVERAGYRNKTQQIQELTDAGIMYKAHLARMYPDPAIPVPPEPEPVPEP